jgi:hypothetical protein
MCSESTFSIRGCSCNCILLTDFVLMKKISKYKLDLVGVQEVRWGRGGTEPAGDYTFFYGYTKL